MCFLSALTKEFAKSGYALLVLPYASDAQAYLMDTIKQQHAEAILALTKDPPRSLTAAASSLPIFWPTSQKSPAAIPLPSIKEEAAYHMINYLLSLGHRHILGISKDGSRLWPKGYERALQEASCLLERSLMRKCWTHRRPSGCRKNARPSSVRIGRLQLLHRKSCAAMECVYHRMSHWPVSAAKRIQVISPAGLPRPGSIGRSMQQR